MGKNLRLVSREESKTRSESQKLGKAYADLDQERQSIRNALTDIHKMRKKPNWTSLQTHLRTRHRQVFSQFVAKDPDGYQRVGDDNFGVWLNDLNHFQPGAETKIGDTRLATDEQLLDMATSDVFSVPVN